MTLRLPLHDTTVGERPSGNPGTIDVGIEINGSIHIYELPVEVWEACKKQGYIDLEEKS